MLEVLFALGIPVKLISTDQVIVLGLRWSYRISTGTSETPIHPFSHIVLHFTRCKFRTFADSYFAFICVPRSLTLAAANREDRRLIIRVIMYLAWCVVHYLLHGLLITPIFLMILCDIMLDRF